MADEKRKVIQQVLVTNEIMPIRSDDNLSRKDTSQLRTSLCHLKSP